MPDAEEPRAIGYKVGMARSEMLERLRTIYPAHEEALGVLAIEVSVLPETTKKA